MSEAVLVVLIPAVSGIVISFVTLLRQILRERRKTKAAQVERQLMVTSEMLSEYRALVDQHRHDAQEARTETAQVRAELVAERKARHELEEDRERWRAEAVRNAHRIEDWLKDTSHKGKETP